MVNEFIRELVGTMLINSLKEARDNCFSRRYSFKQNTTTYTTGLHS